jgi:signal transduction histidine kinase
MSLGDIPAHNRNSVVGMAAPEERLDTVPPVDDTLTWVVILMRLLGWIWMVALTLTAIRQGVEGTDPPSVWVLLGILVLATAGVGLMFVAVRLRFLGDVWYVALDGAICVVALASGWLAGAPDFVAGGYPMSWLFLVAYATTFRGTTFAALILTAVFAWLHVLMGLSGLRVVGSVQFVVVGLIVSWAFDALRHRERLRLEAQAERDAAEMALVAERENATRLEERTKIATRLHDSVLQTLKLIVTNAKDASQVRYLARVQERELRSTINQYRSPYKDSFRARLLDARANIEDQYRVEIEQVIHGDAEMTPQLEMLVAAAREAMANAARHSGIKSIDLFSEVKSDGVQVNVRDRGVGFDVDRAHGGGITHSIVGPVEAAEGQVSLKTSPGMGTDIGLWIPRS